MEAAVEVNLGAVLEALQVERLQIKLTLGMGIGGEEDLEAPVKLKAFYFVCLEASTWSIVGIYDNHGHSRFI